MVREKYVLPDDFWDTRRYNGCGFGWIRVHKDTGTVEEMSYSDDPEEIVREQNIMQVRTAGQVIKETDTHVWYLVNFSCGVAYLY